MLIALYQPAVRWRAIAYRVCWLVAGSLLIAILAQLAVPLYPVPVTGQTFAVLLVGAALGPGLGAATVLLYLLEGSMGLPVFSQGRSGLAMFLGPTGGYLLGFVVAAAVVGVLARMGWDRRFWTTMAAMLIGNLVIYCTGLSWLCMGLGMSLGSSMGVGLYPFIPGDLLKALLAALILPACWRCLGSRAGHA